MRTGAISYIKSSHQIDTYQKIILTVDVSWHGEKRLSCELFVWNKIHETDQYEKSEYIPENVISFKLYMFLYSHFIKFWVIRSSQISINITNTRFKVFFLYLF